MARVAGHEMKNLTNMSDAELRTNLQQSQQLLPALAEQFDERPDMKEAVRILMRPDDMLETFNELAVKDPASRKFASPCGIVRPVMCRPLHSEKPVFVIFSGMPSAWLSCAWMRSCVPGDWT